jgi:hypothetical protein
MYLVLLALLPRDRNCLWLKLWTTDKKYLTVSCPQNYPQEELAQARPSKRHIVWMVDPGLMWLAINESIILYIYINKNYMMYLVMNDILFFFFFIIIRWIPRQTCRMCLCLLSLLSAVVCFLRSVSDKLTNVKDMHHFHAIIILYCFFF